MHACLRVFCTHPRKGFRSNTYVQEVPQRVSIKMYELLGILCAENAHHSWCFVRPPPRNKPLADWKWGHPPSPSPAEKGVFSHPPCSHVRKILPPPPRLSMRANTGKDKITRSVIARSLFFERFLLPIIISLGARNGLYGPPASLPTSLLCSTHAM